VNAGGLHVIGSERHESRRIDNQLRGRCGRQGDPGSSNFYLSLEDNLMRIFASDRVALLMKKLGMKENESIEHPFITKAVENAQRKVEGHNFDIRKHLLEFDDVANEQRRIIYQQRDEIMAAADLHATIDDMRNDVVNAIISTCIPPQSLEEQWDIAGLEQQLLQNFNLPLPIRQWLDSDETLNEETLRERIVQAVGKAHTAKIATLEPAAVLQLNKSVLLQELDRHWKEHLSAMDHLRHGIHLRGYAQQNPKQEYKRTSFQMFTEMLEQIKLSTISILLTVNIRTADDVDAVEEDRRKMAALQDKMQFIHASAALSYKNEQNAAAGGGTMPAALTALEATEAMIAMESTDEHPEKATPFVRQTPKVGRNDPCPCGSGKKYKQCHGKLE
jgi:preprotein translocase subunit SecA